MPRLAWLTLIAAILLPATASAAPTAHAPVSRPFNALKAKAAAERGEWLCGEKRFVEAIQQFDAAIRLDPSNARAFLIRGVASSALGKREMALSDLDRAVQLNPNDIDTLRSRAIALEMSKKPDAALADYTKIIELNPQNFDAYGWRMQLLLRMNKWDELIADCNTALQLDPSRRRLRHVRADAFAAKKDYDRAIAEYEEAIKLHPLDADAWSGCGCIRVTKCDWRNAVRDFDAALAVDPDDKDSLRHRSIIRASCPDAKLRDANQAYRDARRLCEVTEWKEPWAIANLAAACAEGNLFDEAVKWQMRAMEMPPYAAVDGDKARERLKLYENKKPYRLPEK